MVILNKNQRAIITRFGEIQKHEVTCFYCNKKFFVFERTKLFPSKEKYFCSQSCAHNRGPRSEETKLKISKSNKGKRLSPEQQIKQIASLKKYYKDNPKNKDISENQKNKYRTGQSICLHCGEIVFHSKYKSQKYHGDCWKKCSGGYRKNSTRKTTMIYDGVKLDSGAEIGFVKFCEKNNIKWIKNTTIGFPYIGTDNKHHKYYPDFYLPKFDYWIEIKGKLYADLDSNINIKKSLIDKYVYIDSKDVKKLTIQIFYNLINYTGF